MKRKVVDGVVVADPIIKAVHGREQILPTERFATQDQSILNPSADPALEPCSLSLTVEMSCQWFMRISSIA